MELVWGLLETNYSLTVSTSVLYVAEEVRMCSQVEMQLFSASDLFVNRRIAVKMHERRQESELTRCCKNQWGVPSL